MDAIEIFILLVSIIFTSNIEGNEMMEQKQTEYFIE
jgi:hypothetical protein